jgi:hypothetical protein
MSQHQCININSTLKTTKPTKTPKIPNRQKSFVNVVNKTKTPKNSRQKFPRNKKLPPAKNSRPTKISATTKQKSYKL